MFSILSFVLLALSASPALAIDESAASRSTLARALPPLGVLPVLQDSADLAANSGPQGHKDNSDLSLPIHNTHHERLATAKKSHSSRFSSRSSSSSSHPHAHAPAMGQFGGVPSSGAGVGAEVNAVSKGKAQMSGAGHSAAGKHYKIDERWEGNDFFDGWNFYNRDDPTHGLVDYVSESEAKSAGLAYVSNGVAYMKVDTKHNLGSGQGRKSVRIASKKRFDGGLFVADIKSMPHGPATWPAFWTVGTNWPHHGEIDIIEGVNSNTHNQYTIHSSKGCEIDQSTSVPSAFLTHGLASSVSHPSCGSTSDSNNGCAFIDSHAASYGKPLNDAGGAVFVMEWTRDGIRIWNFPRPNVPSDLESQNPNPANWSRNYLKASWSSVGCDTKTYFKQHAITFNISLCGDWAGHAFPGGKAACEAYVKKGSNFANAFWAINSVSVYQLS